MDKRTHYVLRRNREALIEKVDGLEVVDFLYQEGVIGHEDLADVQAEKTTYRRMRVLLNILLTQRKQDTFQKFLFALRRADWSILCDQLEKCLSEVEDTPDVAFQETATSQPSQNEAEDTDFLKRTGWQRIHGLAENGDFQEFKKLAVRGADICAKTQSGKTPLTIAVEYGHAEIVAYIVQACGCKQYLTDILMKSRNTLNSTSEDGGFAPLHEVVLKDDDKAVDLLLASGADPMTKASACCVFGRVNAHELAICNGSSAAQRVLARFLYPESCGRSWNLMHYALMESSTMAFSHLLTRRLDLLFSVNADGETPLAVAIRLRLADIVTEMFKACEQESLAEHIMRRGWEVNATDAQGNTGLHHAVESSSVNAVKALLAARSDTNKVNKAGESALLCAVVQNDLRIAGMLLQAGANPNIGHTVDRLLALHLSPSAEFTRALLNSGANPNVYSNCGATPLHYAAWRKFASKNEAEGIATALVRSGTRINYQMRDGRTALHLAIEQLDTSIASVFLHANPAADLNLADARNETPKELAERLGFALPIKTSF